MTLNISRVALCYEIVCTKFKLSQAIRSRNVTFFMLVRYVMLWPWPLTRWPWKFVLYLVLRGHIVCSKLDRNRTFTCWVVDNLANFCPHFDPVTLTSGVPCWDSLAYQIWAKYRTIGGWVIDHLINFRFKNRGQILHSFCPLCKNYGSVGKISESGFIYFCGVDATRVPRAHI